MSKIFLGDKESLEHANPAIAAEWHPNKNGELLPTMFTAHSGKKVWWQCALGHEWEAPIYRRSAGSGCPYCANQKVWIGYNDLASQAPEIAAEWHPTRNGDLSPTMVTAQSKARVWWNCPRGHEWQASISNRYKGTGCPYCHNKKTSEGFNDLQTFSPELASEWHPTRNNSLKPTMVTPKSSKYVWWLCYRGHEWQDSISHRADGRGCPICSHERRTSFPEQAIFYYIKKYFPDAINSALGVLPGTLELDIWIPSIKTAIEYDGVAWHQQIAKDRRKNEYCKSLGIRLIRIREANLPKIDSVECIYRASDSDNSLNQIITTILEVLDISDCGSVSVETERHTILENYISSEKQNSLEKRYPEIAAEWDYQKNQNLLPSMVLPGSEVRVWWICKEGHEWESMVYNRVNGNGCPYCSKRRPLQGKNDLLSLYPLVASEWHPTKNGKSVPSEFAANSNRKVWWLCPKGHEWEAVISNRTQGTKCPICANQKIITSVNDLLTINPKLAAEWHPSKNGKLLPSMVAPNSGIKVWWQCALNHEWEATIASRNTGVGCPYCAGKRILPGFNDLSTTNRELANEWHPLKNKPLTPMMVGAGSEKSVWWQCPKGHEWKAAIYSRTAGSGCPYCAGKYPIIGETDIFTLYPNLQSEWDYDKNQDINPLMLGRYSKKKAWWICKNKHEWEASICSRTRGGKCPICKSKIEF